MSGPADQARFGQFSNYGVLRSNGLLGVGGDDFKIPSCAEREEGVLRAASRVNAAERSSNARALLDKGNAPVEITAAQENVVERGGHVIHSPSECRHCESTAGNAKKQSARHDSQYGRLLRRK